MTNDLNLAAAVGEWNEEEGDSLRAFSMLAYTGSPISLGGWDAPVVIDLNGVEVTEKARPILRDHNPSQIVGHTTQIDVSAEGITVEGLISGSSDVAAEVVNSSRNGFPWQASIGARAVKTEKVRKGSSANVNGQKVAGPAYVVRQSVLGEVSFVALGADDATSAKVAASAAQNQKGYSMFDQWVIELGLDPADLSDEQKASLQAAFDVQNDTGSKEVTASIDTEAEVKALRGELAIEASRVREIRATCGNHGDIEAKAISEGWNSEKAELEVLRAERALNSAPAAHIKSNNVTSETLEAALCMSAGLDENTLVKSYGEQTMEAANPMRSIGLRELCAQTAKLEGQNVPAVFGSGQETIRASFSTMSLPGILENVMNKTLLSSYEAQSITALEVCKVSSVSDFKQVKRHRLLGSGEWSQVAADGELRHAITDEQTFTNQADTYGQMITLTRQDVINDDLNAFLEIPREMGRQGAYVIDDLFFKMLLANTGSHFSAGNGNLLTSGSAFGVGSLGDAYEAFRKMKAGAGDEQRPINIRPETLLVPVELEIQAQQLIGSPILMTGNGETQGATNPHSGKYGIKSSPLLSDSAITGNSAAAWYMMANPAAMAFAELVFLNGKKAPTIERIEGAPNYLTGMAFRGYLDVGVNFMDSRACIKCDGTS